MAIVPNLTGLPSKPEYTAANHTLDKNTGMIESLAYENAFDATKKKTFR